MKNGTPYLAYFKQNFKAHVVYRIEWILGIVNSIIQIFISIILWKTLYAGSDSIKGIDFSIITTNFIISLGLSHVLETNDFAIQRKLNDGSIANELLKPIDFRKILLANTLAEISFKFISNFIPTCIIAVICFGILPPAGIYHFLLFLISILLGFFVIWSLSLIVQMTAFWIINVWSISTIKNVLVKVFSGALLPLYFMPVSLMKVIEFTPFDSIYHIPLQIYLGRLETGVIILSMIKQLLWGLVLYLISLFMWYKGCKNVILQGG